MNFFNKLKIGQTLSFLKKYKMGQKKSSPAVEFCIIGPAVEFCIIGSIAAGKTTLVNPSSRAATHHTLSYKKLVQTYRGKRLFILRDTMGFSD